MKKLLFTVLVIYAAILFSSCEKVVGDGPVRTETRNETNFSGIDLRVSGNVYYKVDAVYKVEITAQQNIIDVTETYVSNNKLVIKFKNDVRVRSHEDIIVMISGPQLNSIRVSGSGNITTTGNINTNTMDLDISGSGNINMQQLTAAYFDANISGSGNISVDNGSATEERLKISGSGNIDLQNVLASKATTTTSGSGDMWLNVSKNLDVTISGSGSVRYKGNPIINTSISGSGKVTNL
jgi:hypothetical protein